MWLLVFFVAKTSDCQVLLHDEFLCNITGLLAGTANTKKAHLAERDGYYELLRLPTVLGPCLSFRDEA